MPKKFDLFDKRDILYAATNEVLELCEDKTRSFTVEERRGYVLEASRLAVRLVEVQKEIETNGIE